MNTIQFYESLIHDWNEKCRLLTKKLSLYFYLRLFAFISIVSAIIFWTVKYDQENDLFFSLLILSLLVLVLFFIIKHRKAEKQRSEIRKSVAVCEKERSLLVNPDIARTFESGSNYQDRSHSYSFDLDVFGAGSLFQYINRTRTRIGENKLASYFSDRVDKNEILSRQEAVRELKSRSISLIEWLAKINREKYQEQTGSIESLKLFFSQPVEFKKSRILHAAIYLLPYINILLFVLTIFQFRLAPVFSLFIILQCIVLFRYEKKITESESLLTNHIENIKTYSIILDIIRSENFESAKLLSVKSNAVISIDAIRRLQRYMNIFDQKSHLIPNFLVNTLLLQHLHAAIRLEDWKQTEKENFLKSVESIGEFEALMSIALFSFNHDNFTFPEILSENNDHPALKAENIGHPLIPESKRVHNHFSIGKWGDLSIVTGANMAGKSTFLRTIGVNIVLANLGAPACASSFSFTPAFIFSSMRISDSLNSGSSYFHAEIMRLKQLKEVLEEGRPVLIIIDELFSGTNSEDRETASILYIESLLHYKNMVGIIATHDIALTKLEEKYPRKITNYCFEIDHENREIVYSYKIRKGITHKKNALILLRQLNLI